jgi:hypothetical protein
MPNLKNIIIFVSIAAAFVLVYIFFIRQPAGSETPTLVATPAETGTPTLAPVGATGAGGQDFLTLLLSVRSIRLDTGIFADPAFQSLYDSTIVLLPDTTKGRPNPFAPIGIDIAPPAPAEIPPTTTAPTTIITPVVPVTPAASGPSSGTTGTTTPAASPTYATPAANPYATPSTP